MFRFPEKKVIADSEGSSPHREVKKQDIKERISKNGCIPVRKANDCKDYGCFGEMPAVQSHTEDLRLILGKRFAPEGCFEIGKYGLAKSDFGFHQVHNCPADRDDQKD